MEMFGNPIVTLLIFAAVSLQLFFNVCEACFLLGLSTLAENLIESFECGSAMQMPMNTEAEFAGTVYQKHDSYTTSQVNVILNTKKKTVTQSVFLI